MDSGRERERRKGGKRREGPHSEEEETTKKLGSGSGAEGDISNYTEPKEGGNKAQTRSVGRPSRLRLITRG